MTLKELRESLQKCCDEAGTLISVDVSQVRQAGMRKSEPVISILITFFDEDQGQQITASGLLEIQWGEPDIKEQTPWHPKEGE